MTNDKNGLKEGQDEEKGEAVQAVSYPLVVCHECDALFQVHDIPPGARANCTRCGNELYRHIPNSLDKCLALYISALVLIIIANVNPFLTMKTKGIFTENHFVSGGIALYEFGMGELGLVVFLTSILFPMLSILGMLYLLVPLKFGHLPFAHGPIYRVVKTCEPWSLLSVFMLGTLIAVVKLRGLATVAPGLGMFGFIGLLFVYSAARVRFDPEILWRRSSVKQLESTEIDQNTKIICCHTCGLIRPFSELQQEHLQEHQHQCDRCGSKMHYRRVNSLERTSALLISACLMLIPANLLPVMTIKMVGKGNPDTIISGVIHLFEGGLWGLAMIVLIASIIVPGLKLSAMSFLIYSVKRKSTWKPRDRTFLYRITEVVGAWSMVDVFLVGLLSGLVQLGFLATVEPGLGVVFFGAAVILTMLAAKSFDPRLIWDGARLKIENQP